LKFRVEAPYGPPKVLYWYPGAALTWTNFKQVKHPMGQEHS